MKAPTGQAWLAAFSGLESCPWPGPRPLRSGDDRHLLCGRDEDKASFLNEVDSYRVIFLTGSSGVGKTSLLQRGLVPELEDRGYLVAVCRDWSGAAEEKNPAAFLASRVAEALRNKRPDLPEDTSIIRELSQQYGDRAILILDQFEELIRDARGFAQQLFDALASLNKHSDIKIIISLRSEHLHELRPLEHRVQPFSTTYFYLEPVKSEYIPEVIGAGNETALAQSGELAIDDEAAAAIKLIWDEASRIENSLNSEPPGLLGLQALLYVLNARSGGHTVTLPVLEQFRSDKGAAPGEGPEAVDLFTVALSEAANVKLDRCRAASVEVGIDEYLIEGAMSILARSVQHLTSGGYKLVRNVWDLANLAMDDEFEALRRGCAATRDLVSGNPDGDLTTDQERAIFDIIVRSILDHDVDGTADRANLFSDDPSFDFLAATRRQIAQLADGLTPNGTASWTTRLHESSSTFDADPLEVTSGPLMGRAPAEVLIEELRRFALAMQWLRSSFLVRFSTPTAGLMMIALIHDGFGSALERWSLEQSRSPSGAIHGLTASGGEYRWPSAEGDYLPVFDGSGSPRSGRILVNLRWRGGSVLDTAFRQVMFVNCDFRGALFARCRFDGVSFINCLLDGLMVSDCHIAGRASPRPDAWALGPSGFGIVDSSKAAELVARYRDGDSPGSFLLADIPGLPAVPARDETDLVMLEVEPGSLVIRGGRTASLAVRAMSFAGEASFCLRDTAGSGFDVIEHSSAATYEITGCVLRHVTFTTPPHRAESAEPLVISAHGSAIYQAWIGDDLKGSFRATDCTLLDIWNGSPPEVFEATAGEGSTYHGLVAVNPDDSCQPLIAGERVVSVEDLDGPGTGRIVAMSHLMDYRRSSVDEEAVVARRGQEGG